MSRKRSDVEIIAEILQVARTGARKSHIVYKANLNFKIANRYLDLLKESDLITEPSSGEHVFLTTEKGVEYLSHFEEFKDYLS